MIGRLLCRLGLHAYTSPMILATANGRDRIYFECTRPGCSSWGGDDLW